MAFEMSVVIARPAADVFAFLSRPENEKQWQRGLVESRQTSAGAMGVGATGEDVRMFMGRRAMSQWTCTAFEPDRRFAFKVTKPLPWLAEYRFDTVPEGTRVTMSGQPVGFTRLTWPVIIRMGRKQYEADFATLKRVFESQA